MNPIRENPFIVIVVLITLVGAGALIYLLMGARTEYAEVSESYQRQEAELQRLERLDPYPNQSNLEAYKEEVARYTQEIQALERLLSGMQDEVEPMRPEAFQDRLRQMVSDFARYAQAGGVTLPSGFYLGFDRYQDRLPSEALTPLLNYQLTIIDRVLRTLVDAGIDGVTAFERVPLPGEEGGPASADDSVLFYPMRVSILGGQSSLRMALNALSGMEQMLIIRRLTVTNEQQEGPSRRAPTPPPGAAPASPLAGAPSQAESATRGMDFVLGQERITMNLSLEVVRFVFEHDEEEAE